MKLEKFCDQSRAPLGNMIDMIIEEIAARSKCIVFILDPFYRRLAPYRWQKGLTSYYTVINRAIKHRLIIN